MCSEAAVENAAGVMANGVCVGVGGDWQTVDRALRTIAARRAALDAEEARWLREAEAMRIWRRLGMVSALDYMERVLGYAPRAAQERLRVARALGSLPGISDGLASGELSFSAVRELTRVVTPETELDWRVAALGKNLRQIEELVADHRPGDRPDDPKDPEVRTRVVRVEMSAETFALWRQARQALDGAHGTRVSDDEAIGAMCSSVLEGSPTADADGRARFQIAVTICERCRQGWQEGAGAQIAISPAAVERAECDAQHIGTLESAVPQRAYQDVPLSVARLVRRRDGGRCRVPGCRSARGLELHHLVHRADDGSHEAANLILCCSACHQAHHDGTLTISGTAERIEVRRMGEKRTQVSSRRATGEGGVAAVDAAGVAPIEAPASASVVRQAGRGAHVRADELQMRSADEAQMRSADEAQMRSADEAQMRRADEAQMRSAHEAQMVGADELQMVSADAAHIVGDARKALAALGWTRAIAHAAVAAAVTSLAAAGPLPGIERLIFEALRRCPRPHA